MPLPTQRDTIAALSSARGPAGVALVRLSGPAALTIGRRLFRPQKATDELAPRTMILGHLLDAAGEPLDQVLFVYFPPGGSYTGETIVEFHLHGGPVIVEAALDAMLAGGARIAEPGEFTRRAFLSGRLDLSQAEAVAELIHAKSLVAARAAHRRLTGALSDKVDRLRDLLAEALALCEADIDFPDQDLGAIDPAEIVGLIDRAGEAVAALIAGHARARALAQGAVVALAGRPNAGKSRLLNRLAGARRALVHETAGTTRDLIEAEVVLAGVPVRLIDTAGLRHTEQEIERQGVDLARETIAGADLAVYLIDGALGRNADDDEHLAARDPARTIVVWNKADVSAPGAKFPGLAISAKTGAGVEALVARIVEALGAGEAGGEALLASVRQRELIERAAARLHAARAVAGRGRGFELVAFELREAADALAAIVGETTTDRVLDAIFSRFCVGK